MKFKTLLISAAALVATASLAFAAALSPPAGHAPTIQGAYASAPIPFDDVVAITGGHDLDAIGALHIGITDPTWQKASVGAGHLRGDSGTSGIIAKTATALAYEDQKDFGASAPGGHAPFQLAGADAINKVGAIVHGVGVGHGPPLKFISS